MVVHHIERICKPYEQWNPALSWEKNREPKDKALRALKELAQTLQIPVLCTGYLHRSLELRKNKRPRLQDLKKAEIPEELVDQIVFLYRDRYYDSCGTEGAECIIAKSSSGNTGVLELGWDYATGIFL